MPDGQHRRGLRERRHPARRAGPLGGAAAAQGAHRGGLRRLRPPRRRGRPRQPLRAGRPSSTTAYRDQPTRLQPAAGAPGRGRCRPAATSITLPALLSRTLPLAAAVPVDFIIPGCPPSPAVIGGGRRPAARRAARCRRPGAVLAPNASLCDSCPRNGSRPERLAAHRAGPPRHHAAGRGDLLPGPGAGLPRAGHAPGLPARLRRGQHALPRLLRPARRRGRRRRRHALGLRLALRRRRGDAAGAGREPARPGRHLLALRLAAGAAAAPPAGEAARDPPRSPSTPSPGWRGTARSRSCSTSRGTPSTPSCRCRSCAASSGSAWGAPPRRCRSSPPTSAASARPPTTSPRCGPSTPSTA